MGRRRLLLWVWLFLWVIVTKGIVSIPEIRFCPFVILVLADTRFEVVGI